MLKRVKQETLDIIGDAMYFLGGLAVTGVVVAICTAPLWLR